MERVGVPRDTQAEAERRQLEGLRAMTATERLQLTRSLCRAAGELAFAGIRLREGELPLEEMRRRLACMRYGDDLVRRAEAHRANRDDRR